MPPREREREKEKEEKQGKFHLFIFIFFFNPLPKTEAFLFHSSQPLRFAVKANHNERRGIRFGLLFRSDFPIFHAPHGRSWLSLCGLIGIVYY